MSLIMFMTSKFWHFLFVVAGCMEWKLSCFWSTGFGCLSLYSYFAAVCLRLLMEPGTEHAGPTHQKDQAGPSFVTFSGGSCGQRELLMMLYKWSQLKFSDGALLLNQKNSFCTGGLKKLPRIAGRSYFSWHPLVIVGHPREDQPPARLGTCSSLPQGRLGLFLNKKAWLDMWSLTKWAITKKNYSLQNVGHLVRQSRSTSCKYLLEGRERQALFQVTEEGETMCR